MATWAAAAAARLVRSVPLADVYSIGDEKSAVGTHRRHTPSAHGRLAGMDRGVDWVWRVGPHRAHAHPLPCRKRRCRVRV